MNLMEGKMFIYFPERCLTAFMSGNSDRHVIYIAGLTDTYCGAKYLVPLQQSLEKIGFSLVQIYTSSSHIGYGPGSLLRDCEEIDKLIEVLLRDFQSKQIVLLGYSTGCQDAILHAKVGKYAARTSAIILQAPVSDREYMETQPDSHKYLDVATKLIEEQKPDTLLPREAYPSPITAYRYHSLMARGGDDDMFSSDLSDEEFDFHFRHIKVPCLLVASLADEYVPKHINLRSLTARLQSAISKHCTCRTTELVRADHAISDPESIGLFVEQVTQFLSQLSAS